MKPHGKCQSQARTIMTKKKYQNSALDYAEDYLERIFKIEDDMDNRLEKRIEAIVEEKLQQYNLINK